MYSELPQKNVNNSCLSTLDRTKRLGTYGDFACDAAESLVDYTMREAARIIPNPEVIIWTGDTVAHTVKWKQNSEYVLNALKKSSAMILKHFPNPRKFLPAFGNHDNAPDNDFSVGSGMYRDAWTLWSSYIGEENKDTFLSGGFYKTETTGAIYLVLNTNLYYQYNHAYDFFVNKVDPARQFEFMINELRKARECSNSMRTDCARIVHIVAHIAPGVFERQNFKSFRQAYNERFLNIIIEYASVIGGMFFGHHHTDTFHLVKDSSGTSVHTFLMAPSVTPWYSKITGGHNPAFRVYDITESNRVADATTYFVDLDKLNSDNSTQFQVEYSYKEAFGMKQVDGASMRGLLDVMKRNDTVFRKYVTFNSASKNSTLPVGEERWARLLTWKPNVFVYALGKAWTIPYMTALGVSNQKAHLCSIEFTDYYDYYQCLTGSAIGKNVSILSIIIVMIVVLLSS